MSSTTETTQGATRVGEAFGAVFDQVEQWHGAVQQLIASRDVSVQALDELVRSLVVPVLSQRSSLIVGAGFVTAPDLLPEAPWHLAWWLGKFNTFGVLANAGVSGAVTRRLEATEDPSSDSFRDYTMLEWWRIPVVSRAPHITGPYVDYLCTDEYTLTLTVPVLVGGEVVGVIGADLYVEDVERMLLPTLRQMGGRVSLINRASRVVVSTDPHRATGSLLRLDGLAEVLRNGQSGGLADARVLPVEWGGTSLVLVLEA